MILEDLFINALGTLRYLKKYYTICLNQIADCW